MSGDWKRVGWFYALTFLLLLLVPIINALTHGGPLDFDSMAARATAETGLPWNSNMLVVVRLSLAVPSLWLLVLGSSVPTLAALVSLSRNPPHLRRLFARFAPVGAGVSWRQAVSSYVLLVPLIAGCLLATYGLRTVLGASSQYAHPPGLFGAGLLPALLVAAFLDQGGLLEELGWRGFAHQELQNRLLSPLHAAVVVGVGWGLWHIPRDVVSGVIDRLGPVDYALFFLPAFVLGTVVVSILAAYFMNRCGGSVIPAIMVHGLTNDAIGLSGLAAMDVALTPYYQITQALPLAAVAAVILLLSGRRLGRAPTGGRPTKR